MTQLVLTHILEEIPKLEPEELRRVQQAIEAQLTAIKEECADAGFLQALHETGLIAEIKYPERSRKQERRLAPIQGKPISETIIEDRR